MDFQDCLIPSFGEMNAKQVALINSNSYVVKFKKNQVVFMENMPVSQILVLKSGMVKVYKEGNDKKSTILDIYKTGSFIGLLSSFSKKQYQNSASALVDSEVVFTDIEAFNQVIRENGRYALQILRELGEQGLNIFEKLLSLSHKQVPGRIAGIILFFNEMFENEEFEIPLTRQEIADLISSTKESVSRTLAEFKHDRIIEIDDRKINIKSPDLLKMLNRIG